VKNKPTILIIDDDPGILEALAATFGSDYSVLTASSGSEGIEDLRKRSDICCVILDIRMPGMDGLETADGIRQVNPDVPIITYTAFPGDYKEEDICRKYHPFGYVTKAEAPVILQDRVREAVAKRGAELDPRRLVATAREDFGIIGGSRVMIELYRQILTIAPCFRRCLILGETGVGKELVAKALHLAGNRRDKVFRPHLSTQVEVGFTKGDLFGVAKNAFQGADERKGVVETVDGGVLFIDEIADLGLDAQLELLRFLDTGEFCPLGSTAVRRADALVITATNKDLEGLRNKGLFRADLYSRLTEFVIRVPPLRDRREDIRELTDYFIEVIRKEPRGDLLILSEEAYALLEQHDWTDGNVRELLQVIKHLAAQTRGFPHLPTSYAEERLGMKSNPVREDSTYREDLGELTRNYLIWGLRRYKTPAEFARKKKRDLSNLMRTLRKFGVDPGQYGQREIG